ncbi:hypothetical protein [Actinacidiphila sp. ITFR-21]|uniref:hypothetical protein n=1 Tax=Actinacidiphila sp. ITFR-21 TaxID=3075199 RepID=UPI00288B7635|nr:hypothetical protein [Streptomyces sp. ITFR-21]WNI14701.1 hypothetical protein RLT57_03505 [Streptomyces sp. ITFR-21]
MELATHLTETRDNFQRLVSQHTDPETDDSGVYLETLLAQWLYLGSGIEDTAANYHHFLVAVVVPVLRDACRTGVPIGWSRRLGRIEVGPPEQLVGVESPSNIRRPRCRSVPSRRQHSPVGSPGSVTVWLTGSETPPTTERVSSVIRRT